MHGGTLSCRGEKGKRAENVATHSFKNNWRSQVQLGNEKEESATWEREKFLLSCPSCTWARPNISKLRFDC
jgi:hypothetical protein